VTGHALNAAVARSVRLPRWPVAVLLSAVAGFAIALAVTTLAAGGDRANVRTFTAPGKAFSLAVPNGWSSVNPARLGPAGAASVAVLRRADGHALVTVRPTAPVRATGPQLLSALGRQLRPRFPGFRLLSARFAQVRGGRAFIYTFARGSDRTVQSLALVSAHRRAYEIDAVVPAGDSPAARDAGLIIASFGQ
jgi:hypothetical protein